MRCGRVSAQASQINPGVYRADTLPSEIKKDIETKTADFIKHWQQCDPPHVAKAVAFERRFLTGSGAPARVG